MSRPAVDDLIALLDRLDPIELRRGGAPIGEYSAEARTILPRLVEAASAEDVMRVVHEEFVRWFDPGIAGPIEDYRAASRAIWDWWRRRSKERGSDYE